MEPPIEYSHSTASWGSVRQRWPLPWSASKQADALQTVASRLCQVHLLHLNQISQFAGRRIISKRVFETGIGWNRKMTASRTIWLMSSFKQIAASITVLSYGTPFLDTDGGSTSKDGPYERFWRSAIMFHVRITGFSTDDHSAAQPCSLKPQASDSRMDPEAGLRHFFSTGDTRRHLILVLSGEIISCEGESKRHRFRIIHGRLWALSLLPSPAAQRSVRMYLSALHREEQSEKRQRDLPNWISNCQMRYFGATFIRSAVNTASTPWIMGLQTQPDKVGAAVPDAWNQ